MSSMREMVSAMWLVFGVSEREQLHQSVNEGSEHRKPRETCLLTLNKECARERERRKQSDLRQRRRQLSRENQGLEERWSTKIAETGPKEIFMSVSSFNIATEILLDYAIIYMWEMKRVKGERGREKKQQ